MPQDIITVTPEQFRENFSEFSDATKYPDALIERFYTLAICYCDDENYGVVRDNCRFQAIMLMMAHLLKLNDYALANNGASLMPTQSTSIGEVSVSLVPPPFRNLFRSWLWGTIYGQQYYALLISHFPTPIIKGGKPFRILRV